MSYLSCEGADQGAVVDLAQADFAAADAELLLSEGVRSYTQLAPAEPVSSWMEYCVSAGRDPGGPGGAATLVLLASSGRGNDAKTCGIVTDGLRKSGCEAGLVVGENGCANTGLALALADSVVRSSPGRDVLVGAADVANVGCRLLRDDGTVLSDGRALWRVTAAPRTGSSYRLVSWGCSSGEPSTGLERLTALERRLSEAASKATAGLARSPQFVVVGGYGASVASYLASSINCSATVKQWANGTKGHAPSCDVLFALDQLTDHASQEVNGGDVVLAAMSSPGSCIVLALEVIDPHGD